MKAKLLPWWKGAALAMGVLLIPVILAWQFGFFGAPRLFGADPCDTVGPLVAPEELVRDYPLVVEGALVGRTRVTRGAPPASYIQYTVRASHVWSGTAGDTVYALVPARDECPVTRNIFLEVGQEYVLFLRPETGENDAPTGLWRIESKQGIWKVREDELLPAADVQTAMTRERFTGLLASK